MRVPGRRRARRILSLVRLATSLTRHVGRFALIGVVDSDPDEARAQKATLTLAAACVTGLAVIWVATYWVLG